MKVYVSQEKVNSKAEITVSYISFEKYLIYFKNEYIEYSVLKYISKMLSIHGEKYAAFVTAFSGKSIESISERRFQSAYYRSIHEDSQEFPIQDYALRSTDKIESFINKTSYLFRKDPKINNLNLSDLEIISGCKGIVPTSSLKGRPTLVKNLSPIPIKEYEKLKAKKAKRNSDKDYFYKKRNYDGSRIVSTRKSIIVSLVKGRIDGSFIIIDNKINPWSQEKKSALIEACFMGADIKPPVLFRKDPNKVLDQYGKFCLSEIYEVIQGKEVLLTFIEFLSGNLELTGLKHWSELNGKSSKQINSYVVGIVDCYILGLETIHVIGNYNSEESDEMRDYTKSLCELGII